MLTSIKLHRILELKYKPLEKSESESLYIERKKMPYFGDNWHYHEEHELMFTIKGEGVRIVGDNMDHFKGLEIVMIGGGLPHLFKNELSEKGAAADFIVIKFKDLFEDQSFFSLPEFSKISKFIQDSKRGIIFPRKTGKKLKKDLIKFSKSKGASKIILFISIFKALSEEKKYRFLSSEDFVLKTSSKGEDRIQKVINYIGENYIKDISLEDLADISNMTTNSFCRYFKSRTGKTPFQFIREFRVNKACQMLINGEKSIAQVCYDTGFNSFSSFNRIFKNLKKVSASEYKSKYMYLKS